MAGQITVGGSSSGLPGGSVNIGPTTVVGTSTLGEVLPVVLASGDNTITVPAGAVAMHFIPPQSSLVALTVRTVNGDTGIRVAPGLPFSFVIAFDPAALPTSVIIHAASSISTAAQVNFI